MHVRRIVANIAVIDTGEAAAFYQNLLGLDLLMDHGWIKTLGSDATAAAQLSVASQGGSGTAVPDLSIEVDDLDAVLANAKKMGLEIAYGPVSEPWGVRRFFVRDPSGTRINILQHA